ncbi:hypothetical protein C1H46_010755 [Malus baccata]|uniref:2-methoxy-6-polyprenyl-1,4-benzoquinol methylase, mitochondrial n=1 Tax=Malus baccata TaxID=106549 RepID=A0A540MXY6_MALBA|nr:hypothetical protein C1H46_010755 [Malus baccata]
MALRTVTRKLGSKLLHRFSPAALLHSHATSFGFKEVREEEKSRMVGNVFSNVASNYDLMNDVMSAGLHRLWKDRLVSKLNPFPGMKHLDVAGGTGDVAFRILDSVNSVRRRAMQDVLEDDLQEETKIYVCDINPDMLNVGKKRALERGIGEDKSLLWVEGDAEALSFGDNTMDGYTIAFGIRNVTHIEKVLSEAYRVLKRGGRFLCLELSHVDIPVFKEFYDFYSFSVIPALGELVAEDRKSYQYLVESIRRFPPQEKFASMIADAGFQQVEYENLVGDQLTLKLTSNYCRGTSGSNYCRGTSGSIYCHDKGMPVVVIETNDLYHPQLCILQNFFVSFSVDLKFVTCKDFILIEKNICSKRETSSTTVFSTIRE